MNVEYKPEKALQFVKEALAIAQGYNMLVEQVNCQRLIAYAYRGLKQGEKAFIHNQQAVKIAEQNGLLRELHMALYSLSYSWYQVREDWHRSLNTLREAIAVAEQYHFPPSLDVLKDCFNVTFGLGLWQEAERVLKCYRKRIDSSNPRRWGYYYTRIGHIAFAYGKFKKAADAYRNGLTICNKYYLREGVSRRIQLYLGLALIAIGEVVEATENLEVACAYWQGKLANQFALGLRGLAHIDVALGHPAQAITHLRQALQVVKGHYVNAPWPAFPQICASLGQVLLSVGEREEALHHALVGYDKLKKIGHFLLGEAAFVVGQILVAQDKRDEAIVYLNQARDEWTRLELTHHLPEWEAFVREHDLSDYL
jgi:tetratricopeptide (TPR) repeat protein